MSTLIKIFFTIVIFVSIMLFIVSCEAPSPSVNVLDESSTGIYLKQSGHVFLGASDCFN